MRTFLHAKAMATMLRAKLAESDISITHGQSLEAVAHQFGLSDWNALSAKIKAEEDGNFRCHQISPVFRMFDETSSKYFYIDFLGFRLDWEHRFDANAPLYCQVSRGGFVLHLSGHHGDASPGSVAYVTMGAIESFQKELVAKNYKHMNPAIEDAPWGKVMVVTDPSQNRIRFCEPSED